MIDLKEILNFAGIDLSEVSARDLYAEVREIEYEKVLGWLQENGRPVDGREGCYTYEYGEDEIPSVSAVDRNSGAPFDLYVHWVEIDEGGHITLGGYDATNGEGEIEVLSSDIEYGHLEFITTF